jgi:hypothetical protein
VGTFLFIDMRKFIVSSLAVVALAGGGFAVTTLLNTQTVQAQPPIEEEYDSTTGTISTLGGCMVCTNGKRSKNGSGSSCAYSC